MAKLSKTQVQAIREQFRGRITQTHAAHTEFTGKPPVLIPETPDDVGHALALARAAGRTAYVRSGNSVTGADIVSAPEAAVISLEALKGVRIDLQRITVGPATTVGEVATALRHRALFLPLPDQPTISLAAAVLGGLRQPFPRSVGAHPLLWEGVVAADVVPTEQAEELTRTLSGEEWRKHWKERKNGHAGVIKTLHAEEWRSFREKPTGVITRLVLDAALWAPFGGNRWLRVWMVPYSRESFGVLCEELFGRPAPERVDLSLRASTGAYGSRLLVIRATGQERERGEQARVFVEGAIDKAKSLVLWSKKVEGAGASLAAWVGTGPGRAGEEEVHHLLTADSSWSSQNEASFLDEVEAQLKAGAWVDLHLGSLFRRSFLPVSALAASVAAAVVPPALPAANATAAAPAPAAVLTPPPSPAKVGVPSSAPLDSLAATHQNGLIPGFSGEVFDSSDNDNPYRAAIKQYAVSSFDAATIAQRMTPRFVAVPLNATDVEIAVAWAASKSLKVVARSGGHQYCGLSSGGQNTLLIDLQQLATVAFTAGDTQAIVGPGVPLQFLTEQLRSKGVAIPHGECPRVNLGGHIQTGGIGHQLRSLGAALDWVSSFKIVHQDASGGWKEQTYLRPTSGAPSSDQDEVFAAVLGGGPGSWGVLTEMTFDLARDTDAPFAASSGYTRTYPYNRSGWAEAFAQMCQWTEMQSSGTLPKGADFFLSVISGEYELLPNSNLRPAVLLVETTALTPEGEAAIKSAVDAVAKQVSWIDRVAFRPVDLLGGSPDGPAPLSGIVDHGVRSTSSFGGMPGGREFDLPYKKSLYVTRTPLSVDFCDRFVDLVDRAQRHPDVKVVFQGVIGGGKFQENGEKGLSRMQHRDALAQIVFDVFYREGHADTAECFQQEMRELWADTFPNEPGRMFWGTYEDPGTGGTQLDMSLAGTQARYYDSPEVYAALQQIKARVDPTDLFHTSFTVQLPT